MIVVVDASAAVKLVLAEDHSDDVRRLWDEPLTFVAPSVLLPDVAAALQAARTGGRIRRWQADVAQRAWVEVSAEVDLLSVDTDLAAAAGRLAFDRSVRGMDAVYLATAVSLARSSMTGLLSYDARQRAGVRPDDEVDLLPA